MTDTPRDPEEQQLDDEEKEFSNEHPLASPNELAGDAASGLELEFAAREIVDGEGDGLSTADEAQGAGLSAAGDAQGAGLSAAGDAQGAGLSAAGDAQGAGLSAAGDAQGAASGIDYEEDTLPLEGN